jgi:hypothetical protein
LLSGWGHFFEWVWKWANETNKTIWKRRSMRKVGFNKLVGMSFAGLVFGMPLVQAQTAGSLDITFGEKI